MNMQTWVARKRFNYSPMVVFGCFAFAGKKNKIETAQTISNESMKLETN